MDKVSKTIISAQPDSQNQTSETIDSNQLITASFTAFFGDTNAAGTFKLQASNDPTDKGYDALKSGFAPTHWADIPNQSATISSGASALLTIAQCCYRWLRAVWTSTGTGIQTIGVVADVSGSLNSKYFLLNSANAGTGYYVWMNVNSAGVDPLVAGRTGVPITVATNDSAATIGAAIQVAIDALALFIATGTTTVTVTNSASGPFVAMSDGAAPTGFTFAITAGGTTTMSVNLFAQKA